MPATRIEQSQLVRIFEVQTQPELMLLLGAGASISSGVLTATDMMWTFKRKLYCTENRIHPDNFKDLQNPDNQAVLQAYVERQAWYPGQWTDNEYSVLFEQCWPDERQRRQFIQSCIQNAKPSLGYLCLAALINANKVVNIITPNFDDLIEKSPLSGRSTFVISPESASRLPDTLIVGTQPQVFKIHGDFRYDKLQNTEAELQRLNGAIQERLLEFFREHGLIAIGYSGRDKSVMRMLEQAARDPRSFSKGFYWCLHKDSTVHPRVQRLVDHLEKTKRPAHLVTIDSFDDLFYTLYQQCGLQDATIDNIADTRYEQRRPFRFNKGPRAGLDTIRVNAIHVDEFPTTFTQFTSDIDNWDDLRSIISGLDVIASLYRQKTIVACGHTSVLLKAFEQYLQSDLKPFHIQTEMLQRNRGFPYNLYYEIIGTWLERGLGLTRLNKRVFYILPKGTQTSLTFNYKPSHRGRPERMTINFAQQYRSKWKHGLSCFSHPALSYGLEFHDNHLYFIIKPELVLTSNGRDLLGVQDRKFLMNEILYEWYNQRHNHQLLFWLNYLKRGTGNIEVTFPPLHPTPAIRFRLDNVYCMSYYGGA